MEKTIVVIDMVKGFCEKGALADPQIDKDITGNIVNLIEEVKPDKEHLVYFKDTHAEDDKEMEAFPVHCIKGTEEAELLDAFKDYDGIEIEKNMTNGFHTKEFRDYVDTHDDIEYIVTGCCTDICVLTFALTLHTYLNAMNKKGKVVVPQNCVSTYDIPNVHNANHFNGMALDLMKVQGIEVI